MFKLFRKRKQVNTGLCKKRVGITALTAVGLSVFVITPLVIWKTKKDLDKQKELVE